MLDLSIIVVSYNNSTLLKNCLNSLKMNIDREIFVVDNNSSDDSVSMVKQYFPAVKIIVNKNNAGFAKANNQALKLAQGRYILLLNNDTIVQPNCLEQIIKYLDGNPKAGALSPKLLNEDGSVQTQGGGPKKVWLATMPQEVSFICGAAFVIRRTVYEQIGGLDEKFFFYNEDLDWCLRIKKAGWKIIYFPDSAVIHFGGKGTQFISKRARIEGIKGGLYYGYKHYRLGLVLYVPLLLVYCLVSILIAAISWLLRYKQGYQVETIQAFTEIVKIILMRKFR